VGEEICQVCDIIAAVDRDIPLFIQPVTLPDGVIGINSAHILRLQELAACLVSDVRVIPQMHKLLGTL
jgi:7-carboxy-7-deazaguanine synthase